MRCMSLGMSANSTESKVFVPFAPQQPLMKKCFLLLSLMNKMRFHLVILCKQTYISGGYIIVNVVILILCSIDYTPCLVCTQNMHEYIFYNNQIALLIIVPYHLFIWIHQDSCIGIGGVPSRQRYIDFDILYWCLYSIYCCEGLYIGFFYRPSARLSLDELWHTLLPEVLVTYLHRNLTGS